MPQYHKHLQHVEPLPNLPGLIDAQATLDRLRRDVSLLAELEHFVGRAAALPAVLRSRALASLDTGLCQRRHQLLLPNGCASDPPQQEVQPQRATGPRLWRAASVVTCLVLQACVRRSQWHVPTYAGQSAGQRLSKLPGSWCGYQEIWQMMPWQPSLGSCWLWSDR